MDSARETYLIEKALFYAAHFIAGLPPEYRAVIDRDEMVQLLRRRPNFHELAHRYGAELEEATGRAFDIEDY